MRQIFIILIFNLVISVSVFGQNTTTPCPTAEIISPNSVTEPGETITFAIKISGETENSKLKYEWSVSAGTIFEGQYTSTIKVATTSDLSGAKIIVTAKIQDSANNCVTEANDEILMATVPSCGLSYGNYGKISWNEERAWLGNFAIELLNNPESRGHIWLTAEKGENINSVKKHFKKMAEYLETGKIPRNRLTFIIESGEEHFTRLDISPKKLDSPACEKCEIIDGKDL